MSKPDQQEVWDREEMNALLKRLFTLRKEYEEAKATVQSLKQQLGRAKNKVEESRYKIVAFELSLARRFEQQ